MTSVPVTLCGVYPVGPENFLCALLHAEEHGRFIPLWLPPFEGAKLAARLNEWEPRRPDTFEVLFDALDQLGGGLARVEITGYHEGVFMCELATETGTELDCRPCDALAMAKLFDLEIEVDEAVLNQASLRLTPEDAQEFFGISLSTADNGEGSYSASGDAQADADFQELMRTLGVEEGDINLDPADTSPTDRDESESGETDVTHDDNGEKEL
ncbi:bifunctional nuclease family protein [Corynebacterium aquatimens]|uniref:Bifunctional DNase/RNase n=1 Tax=Corynebacterium aquatimens TaxID=1190508 RepID=A0A931DWJ2_9CORY|nr:bifunctional nuclease family protein [Corynebacterium aquatimens]MBG6121562.1 bifunctional DNase/RNase [Corynebacterium aquatimens]WJY65898.1 hypothetical protein CAQUA_05955 [Corynebacterium aquatimens]